ncbi:MAG: PAS domain S-box protein [Peptococcaceae bacterium]|nr:PAS domain S-box protein [Peptococcaceae bacterium]
MLRLLNKKFVFVLPLLAALIYTAIIEAVAWNNGLFAPQRLVTALQNLTLIFFAVLLSLGLYKYNRLKNGKALHEEAMFRLEGENSWLKSVLEGLPLGIVVFDDSGKVVYVNDGFERITGFGREVHGLDFNMLEEKLLPLPERKNSILKRALKNRETFGEHRCSLISRDGRIIPAQANLVPLKNAGESLTGVLWLFNDITSQLELRRLQQKTGFFLDFTSSCVLAVDRYLKVTMFNIAAEKLTGLKKGDVLGRHITEVFNDYEAENYPIIRTIITGEEFHNYEVTIFINGQLRTLLFDTARITDECGTVTGAIGVFKDISERKRIEEELKRTVFAYSKEKSFMRNVLNNIPAAIITYDRNLQPTYMNRMAEEFTGCRWEELAAPARYPEKAGMFNPPGGDFSRHLAAEVLKHGEPILGEQRTIVSRDGAAIPVSLDVHPLYNVLRDKDGVMVIARDIRERREHEQLMFLSRCILNSLNSAVVCIDAGYRVIVFNPPAEKLFGLGADEVVGKMLEDIPYPLFQEENILQNTLKSGTGVRFLETTVRSGENEIMFLINSDAVRDKDDNIVGAVAIFQDITELRRTQNAVRERERLAIIGQMAAGMAHEIKNPLTAVRGFAQLLREKCPENPTIVDYVNIIMEEIDRASGVITSFLQLARPKPPMLEWHSVNNLVEEILAIVSPQAFLKRIAVKYDDNGEILPPCLLDRDQIKQVLLNMCQNAIEAMPEGGFLTIRTGSLPAASEIHIEISDTGCGIPQEKLEKIGVPFYTTKAEGTGLGLSISYSIIGAHKGRVEVRSKEGEGTTFRIYLPC